MAVCSLTHLITSTSPHLGFPPPGGTDAAPNGLWGLGGGRGGEVSLSRARQVVHCKPQSMRTASLGLYGTPPTKPPQVALWWGRGGGGGLRWALASSEVKKAQKPGRKDLLGVNIAFPLKIKFCPVIFF